MTQSLSDALKVSKDKLVSAKDEKQANSQELGRATGELARSQKAKKADEEYVESLARDCKEAAEDWAERQASAKEEMAVIAKAQGILTDRVRVFVQTGVGHGAQAAHADDSESAPNAATRSRLVAKLKELSHKFRSYALVEVVTAAGADPFEKIKGLIEGMIEKLLSEANQEATQKSFCDEEIEKSKEAKDDKTMKSEKLSSRLEKAASNKARIRDLALLDAAFSRRELSFSLFIVLSSFASLLFSISSSQKLFCVASWLASLRSFSIIPSMRPLIFSKGSAPAAVTTSTRA